MFMQFYFWQFSSFLFALEQNYASNIKARKQEMNKKNEHVKSAILFSVC